MHSASDPSSTTAWGAYSPSSDKDPSEDQAIPLQRQQPLYSAFSQDQDDSDSDGDFDDSKDFRVTFGDDPLDTSDEEDDSNDHDHDVDDIVPLASSKRSQWNGSKAANHPRISHPCRVFATVFGMAMAISLAFALLSLLNLGGNPTVKDDPSQPDNRLIKPPDGISIDDFRLSDFKLPPWDWDINSFVPINITNGLKFTKIRWEKGEQYLAVDCPRPFEYHFPSFEKNEFREHASSGALDLDHGDVSKLLPLKQEPYVFVLCPPGNNNANVVFREFEIPSVEPNQPLPVPERIQGTEEHAQPLVDDVVMLLVDAISRAKFEIAMKDVMATLEKINATAGNPDGHRIYDFAHSNVLGQNSPPNKAFIYSGQSIERMNSGPKHWVWDVYEEQGFKTAHTDGECGGEQGIHDYTSGAITFEYSHIFQRIPAQYQMSQKSWCENHDMHVVANVWGQSCTVPEGVRYDSTLMGGMRWNTPYCAGEKAIHQHIMEDLEGWLGSTRGSRRFATYSFMDAHSPDHHHISFDKWLAEHIQALLLGRDGRPPLLSPRSVLVIMADHGLHYGRETYTFPGFIHHKIPPLFVAMPHSLLQERPDFVTSLAENQNRILSHLDLHQTFHHLAYGDQPVPQGSKQSYAEYMTGFIADGNFRRRFHAGAPNETSYAQEYGRSILLPIPEGRTCTTAGIPHDFCAFQPFLDLDPSKSVDALFLRQSLVLISKRMNRLAQLHHVDDVCRPYSLEMVPRTGSMEEPSAGGSFENIGTEDLVIESAYASASTSRNPRTANIQEGRPETRVFYFLVRDRHSPNRKYSITMREDELVEEKDESMMIQQMSAYASAWHPCSRRISQGGKAIGKWQDVVKHFCVC